MTPTPKINELTIDLIAKHLPYGLKIMSHYVSPEYTYIEDAISTLHHTWNEYKVMTITNCLEHQFKPILRPISDIKKDQELRKENRPGSEYNFALKMLHRDDSIYKCQYDFVIKLIERHYDVDNLIEKGLAIDVNTLNKNPYE